ncbi:hypothetical protein MUK42_02085 [Musa troglodytarum]|uniref:Uncharacterized protein n=1 Tax=Musa troglodytarum TaxID=320322 RepID=A0A9E7K5H8_9LILI|nr:hypothetical protein MUK42_02085 [Musa troglodytarum]
MSGSTEPGRTHQTRESHARAESPRIPFGGDGDTTSPLTGRGVVQPSDQKSQSARHWFDSIKSGLVSIPSHVALPESARRSQPSRSPIRLPCPTRGGEGTEANTFAASSLPPPIKPKPPGSPAALDTRSTSSPSVRSSPLHQNSMAAPRTQWVTSLLIRRGKKDKEEEAKVEINKSGLAEKANNLQQQQEEEQQQEWRRPRFAVELDGLNCFETIVLQDCMADNE